MGTCIGQVEGAAAQAFAQAMFEELRYRGYSPTMRRRLPIAYRACRTCPDSSRLRHGEPVGIGPGGLKGIGEAGMLGIAAAIANAIEDATGASLTKTPFTPERVLAALDAREVIVKGTQIVVAHAVSGLHAFQAICPHEMANLATGRLEAAHVVVPAISRNST